MPKHLSAKAIRYTTNQLEKGRRASVVAVELGVMPRHIRRLRTEFRETRSDYVPRLLGRPTLSRRPRRCI